MSLPRIFTLDDFWTIRNLGNIAVSPNGRRVAFELHSLSREQNEQHSALYILHLDEQGHAQGSPHRLTRSTKSETSPIWAADSRRLLFLSNREGDYAQLWLIDTNGGEASKLTDMLHGVQEADWSPDGHWIAFTAPAAPDDDDDLRMGRKSLDDEARKRHAEEQRNRLRTITELDYRRDGRGYYDTFAHLFVMPAPISNEPVDPAHIRRLTYGNYTHTQPAWTPDNQEIGVVCNRCDGQTTEPEVNDLWAINVENGEERCLTEGNMAIECYSWAPDGQSALVIGAYDERVARSLARLYLVTRRGNIGDHPLLLTPDLDLATAPWLGGNFGFPGPYKPQWSPDSQQVYFITSERGHANIYHLDIVWRTLTQLSSASITTFIKLLPEERGLLIAQESANRPFELYLLPLTDGSIGKQERLTSLSEDVIRDYRWPKKEKFSFTGADGEEIDGWLVYPIGAKEGVRYPLVVEVHGGPHWAYGDELNPSDAYYAGKGFAVFYCNPHGSTGHGEDFLRSVLGDWGGKDFEDIMRGVDVCIERGVADPERLVITGYSYGGYMTMYAIGHTERFKAAVPRAGISNLVSFVGTSDMGYWQTYEAKGYPWDEERKDYYYERSPINAAIHVTTPTRIIHPENDLRCPTEQSEQFYMALKLIGKAPVEMVRVPNTWHSGTSKPGQALAMWEQILDWFTRYIELRPEEYQQN